MNIIKIIVNLLLPLIYSVVVVWITPLNVNSIKISNSLLIIKNVDYSEKELIYNYDLFNFKKYVLDSSNTKIRYSSSAFPLKVLISDSNGNIESLKINKNINEIIDCEIPNRFSLKSRLSIKVYYDKNIYQPEGDLSIIIKDDPRFSNTTEDQYFNIIDLLNSNKILRYVVFLQIIAISFFAHTYVRKLFNFLKVLYKRIKEDQFTKNKNQFLTGENK